MIQGRVDRKKGGRETGRGQWGGGDWDGETGETEMGRGAMGRRRGRWSRAGKGQEWDGKGEAGGWTRRSGVGRGGGDRIGTMGRRLGGGNGEGKMERGQRRGRWGGGQREGGDGRGAKGSGRRRSKRRRHFTDGYDLMSGWIELQADSMPGATEVRVFTVSYKHI